MATEPVTSQRGAGVASLEWWVRRRPLPYVRALRTSLRTLHLMAFGALYGGHVYSLPAEQLLSALFATVASGGAPLAW